MRSLVLLLTPAGKFLLVLYIVLPELFLQGEYARNAAVGPDSEENPIYMKLVQTISHA